MSNLFRGNNNARDSILNLLSIPLQRTNEAYYVLDGIFNDIYTPGEREVVDAQTFARFMIPFVSWFNLTVVPDRNCDRIIKIMKHRLYFDKNLGANLNLIRTMFCNFFINPANRGNLSAFVQMCGLQVFKDIFIGIDINCIAFDFTCENNNCGTCRRFWNRVFSNSCTNYDIFLMFCQPNDTTMSLDNGFQKPGYLEKEIWDSYLMKRGIRLPPRAVGN